jgi:hypothetical protein
MASRRPSQQPTVYIPAVRDEDDVPTNPMATTHERPTSRPAAPGWVVEPVLTYDREARTWRLAVPYDAEQRDKHGNTFLVHCQPDLPIRLADPMELRADVVAAQLERSMQSAFVMPFTGDQTAEVDSRWRLVIVQAFRAGDRGELPRG